MILNLRALSPLYRSCWCLAAPVAGSVQGVEGLERYQ